MACLMLQQLKHDGALSPFHCRATADINTSSSTSQRPDATSSSHGCIRSTLRTLILLPIAPHSCVFSLLRALYSLQATQSSPRTLSGGGNAPSPCDYQLKWDATPLTPLSVNGNPVAAGFMSRAVILSIHLQQGSGHGNTASFVGWLRIKTGSGAPVAYDYTWQFGA